ncbi:hypothetical protein ABG775_08415 [Peribacillus simplex]|uniref:hypothetical protein n=1 Tax=Peribacillus TaxID=2675229 RepID=UPI00315DF195
MQTGRDNSLLVFCSQWLFGGTIAERYKKEDEKEKNNALQTCGKEFNLTSNKQGFTI